MRLAVLPLVAACSSVSHQVPADAPDIEQVVPAKPDVDVLFVIENTSGMPDKQTVLAANFPKFVQALDAFPTGRPNLHIGIVSSTVDIGVTGITSCPSPDPSDDGLLQNTPRITGCSPPNGRFLSDISNSTGGRTTNYSGTLDAVFACIAQIGATGCPYRAPLEAIKRALDGTRPENAGFLRPGALLAIVIVGDEDDCSTPDTSLFTLPADQAGSGDFRCVAKGYACDQPISTTAGGTYSGCTASTGPYERDPAYYYQFLETLKSPGLLVVATIIGDPSSTITVDAVGSNLAVHPSCMVASNGASGLPGLRIAQFAAQATTARNRQYSICQSDYSAALTDIAQLLFTTVSPCIQGPFSTADTDPNNPGTQLDCVVTDVEGGTKTVLPTCTMASPTVVDPSSPTPCWWTDANATSCPNTTSHFEMNFQRASALPTGAITELHCN